MHITIDKALSRMVELKKFLKFWYFFLSSLSCCNKTS